MLPAREAILEAKFRLEFRRTQLLVRGRGRGSANELKAASSRVVRRDEVRMKRQRVRWLWLVVCLSERFEILKELECIRRSDEGGGMLKGLGVVRWIFWDSLC